MLFHVLSSSFIFRFLCVAMQSCTASSRNVPDKDNYFGINECVIFV